MFERKAWMRRISFEETIARHLLAVVLASVVLQKEREIASCASTSREKIVSLDLFCFPETHLLPVPHLLVPQEGVQTGVVKESLPAMF